jgi:hypothetical protein
MSRTVLVTGATLRRFLEKLSGSVSYREVDVTDRAAVAVLVRDVRPARAVHGAAITSIPPEVERARFVETVEVKPPRSPT